MKGFSAKNNSQKSKKIITQINLSKEQIINKAFNFHQQGNISEAAKYYQYFIRKGFKDHRVFSNYAQILQNKGHIKEAEILTRKAIKLKPDLAEAYSNLGIILKDLGNLKEAKTSTLKAIQLKPDLAEAYSNLGTILKILGNFKDAEISQRKAIQLKPNLVEAYSNLGNTLKVMGKLQEAKKIFQRCLEIQPNEISHISSLLAVLSSLCAWDEIKIFLPFLKRLGLEGKSVNPLELMHLEDNPENDLNRAIRYFQYNKRETITNQNSYNNSKINIGYFSSDFKEHPVTILFTRILELHDNSRFNIFAYSLSKNNDIYTKRIKSAVFLYREISDLSDIDIVNMVRNDQIDIAIDLNGLTENNRKYIFDYRVAPVQINYLGYPGTMGSRSHDYIIADKVLIPEESKRFYTEKILYLPNSSLPYDDTTKISPNRFRREDLGLPSKGFIFACFNNTKKISRNEFHIWMNLLKKIDQSYLWLIKPNQEAINNIHLEISKYGIEKERIIFAERMRLDNHLSRHYCADLFLDTFNFNAASTASIALSCGLPIITLFGKSYTARIAASILSACNLNELITHNLKEYEKLAYELATNREKFNQIRRKLKNNANLHFNSGKYTRELEKIYINIMNTSLVKDKGYNTE